MSLKAAYRRGDGQKRPGWAIQFAYDPEVIEALKKAVPPQFRSWDDELKEWWVHVDYEDALLRLWPDFEAYTRQMSFFD